MRKPALRLLSLLLALVLTGVFAVPARAEGYTEYSGGLSVLDARAATQEDLVQVTVRQLGLDGSVIATATYEVTSGETLPAEAFADYDSQYLWYDADGNQITSPSTMTFTEDTTITTRPGEFTSGVGAHFYVYLDGAWQKVGQTSTLYGRYTIDGGSRYLISVTQLEAAFAPYGFDADSYTDSTDRRFAYRSQGGSVVWADTTSFVYYGEWMLPLSPGITNYDIFYLPDNPSGSNGFINGGSIADRQEANAFWTVTLTEETTGTTATVILEEETVLSDWLASMAGTTLPGFTYPVERYVWELTDSGADLADTDTAQTVHALTGVIPTVTVTLVDEDGTTLSVVEHVEGGTVISDWLTQNDALELDNGSTVHEYTWSLPNDTAISNQSFQQDTTLVGTKKAVYTVTFRETNPGDPEAGGTFVNDSEAYTTLTVIEGDCIPAEFIARMRQNITLAENWAFVEWQYEGNEGYLVMDANTPIVKDTIVWADYTQEVYVRFWTDRSMTTLFAGTGLEIQPVGELYEGAVPSADAIAAAAPVEGMRFRYWYDLNSGTVFTPGTDQVKGNLDLYPVFERAIFEFTDAADGSTLTVLYDGSALNYEDDPPEGYYYAGLEVACSDGSTFVIPNGTEISRDYLTANNVSVPDAVNGRYTIPATPVYRQERTIVYHTGDDAQFIIYGAEDQNSYTVTVDSEVVLLGALDIINVTSPIGLALDGWSTTPDSTTAQFAPNATFEGETALDTLVEAGGTVHLYPVWAQQENTIAITFVSNYPDDAVDENYVALTERSYIIYIKEGSKPTMPTLEKAGVREPANICNGTQQRYMLAGWSLDQDGKLEQSGTEYTEKYGTYTEGSQYLHAITENKTFYAIWVDRAPETTSTTSTFHIRTDGTMPIEPSQYTASGYLPGTCGTGAWTGTIKKQLNVVNNVEQVEANILAEPDVAMILAALQANESYYTAFPEILDVTVDEYGDTWWIDWYACKYACGYHYHVDGRVRFASRVELNYHPNGGSNVPVGTQHEKGTTATISTTHTPVRENFVFIGWDEDPAATVPDYPAPGLSFTTSPNLTTIFMDTDKDLYAIWQPVEITIPMDDDFRGLKYEQTNTGVLTPPQEGRTYQFTIEAIELPEGATAYQTRTVTSLSDGSFTFPQIHVQVEGMYVFEVREVIGDLPVQYDTAVYRLTINIVRSDYGLGIAGYSFTRNNKVITVTDNNVDNVVFTFVNRTDIRSVTASKVWDDSDNQDGLRPASVQVTLLRRGDSIFSQTATLTAAGGWTWTWDDLDIKDAQSGELYEYYIVEDPVPSYGTTYTGDMNSGLVVINSYPPRLMDVSVVKVWQDGEVTGLRPESLTYRLVGETPDGTVVINNSSGPVGDSYGYTFTDMPLYYKGNQLHYTLTEDPVAGYEASVTGSTGTDGTIFTVTNTRIVTPVTITKQITGNAASMDAEFDFTAKVLDADGNVVTDIPAGEGCTVDADGTIRFTLGHEGSVTLQQMPLGGTLVLAEDSGDYAVNFSPAGTKGEDGQTFTIADGLAITVTNVRETPIPTGVALDSAPYLLLMGLALLGLAGVNRQRKRRAE